MGEDMERLEALAETLHRAETAVVADWFNVVRPRWFALRDDYKAEARARALHLTERYEDS